MNFSGVVSDLLCSYRVVYHGLLTKASSLLCIKTREYIWCPPVHGKGTHLDSGYKNDHNQSQGSLQFSTINFFMNAMSTSVFFTVTAL